MPRGRPRAGARLLGALLAAAIAGLPAAATAATATAAAAAPVGGVRPAAIGLDGPTRVVDTRIGLGTTGGALAPGEVRDVFVLPGATGPQGAVVLNVTVTRPTTAGFLTVYPTGTARPGTSSLNFRAGQTVANLVIMTVPASGEVRLFNSAGSTHVVIDLTGTLPPGEQYTGLTPSRLLDTRNGTGAPAGALGAGRSLDLQVAGRGGVPASGAVAVALNVTGTGPTAATAVSARPTGGAASSARVLSLGAGETRAGMTVVGLGTAGKVTLTNAAGSTQLVADVSGWFTAAGQLVPVQPYPLLDTRTGLGTTKARLGAGQLLTVTLRDPAGAQPAPNGGVMVAITAIGATAATYLTVFPTDASTPSTSTLNLAAGQTVTNTALVRLDAAFGSTFFVSNAAGTVDLEVDLMGRVNRPVTVSSTHPAEAAIGVPYRQQLTSSGGEPGSRTWSLDAGSLPPGLSLTADGVISGTPTATATFPFTVRVTDPLGSQTTAALGLPVLPFVSRAVWGWGGNSSNALGGDPALPTSSPVTPVRARGADGITAVAGGGSTAFALKADGTVLAWGSNLQSATGTGSTAVAVPTPTPVPGLTGVVAVAGASTGGFALKADGTVWSWGQGVLLGNGGTGQVNSGTPVQVSGLTGVTAIAASPIGFNGYALKADGTVWSWGAASGSGVGTNVLLTSPAQVPRLTGITAIGAGPVQGYAISSTGAAWGWGSNLNGLVGDGTTTGRSTPVPLLVSGVKAIVASRTAYALKTDGTVVSWGAGTGGALGNGTSITSLTPVPVTGLTGVTQLSALVGMGMALRNDGSVWLWGSGQATTAATPVADRTVPFRADLLPPVTAIAAGSNTAYALGQL